MPQAVFDPSSVCQVALIVRDIEASAKRFADVLGCEAPAIRTTPTRDISNALYKSKPTDARAKLAFFKLGPLSLELIEPIGENSTWMDHLREKGEGLHHIAFMVKDDEATIRDLSKRDIPVVQRGDYTGGRYTYVDATKQLSMVIELLQNVPATK